MPELVISGAAASLLATHLRLAAVCATSDDVDGCASEALLAWTILGLCGGRAAARDTDELAARVGDAVAPSRQAALIRRTQALALSLQGHFVSEGQFDKAAVYEAVAPAAAHALDDLGL